MSCYPSKNQIKENQTKRREILNELKENSSGAVNRHSFMEREKVISEHANPVSDPSSLRPSQLFPAYDSSSGKQRNAAVDE